MLRRGDWRDEPPFFSALRDLCDDETRIRRHEEISMRLLSFLIVLAYLPMLLETRRSVRNERALRAAGAVEPKDDVYPWMQLVYPTGFLAMIVEGWARGATVTRVTIAGAIVFLAAKALKYWTIATLGGRWSFRVLVPPRSSRILRGPYRLMRHPNYLGVAGEIAGFAMLAGAPIAGVLMFAAFGAIMLARIRVEERALGMRSR
jgi:methyltransferase